MFCSYVGVFLWKILYVVRRELVDKSCIDKQVKWNKGIGRNLEMGVIKKMNFKKVNIIGEIKDIFDEENNNI